MSTGASPFVGNSPWIVLSGGAERKAAFRGDSQHGISGLRSFRRGALGCFATILEVRVGIVSYFASPMIARISGYAVHLAQTCLGGLFMATKKPHGTQTGGGGLKKTAKKPSRKK